MAVGSGEIGSGTARHEKVFEHAILDNRDTLAFYTLVVHFIAAEKRLALEVFRGRIIKERNGRGEDASADAFGPLAGATHTFHDFVEGGHHGDGRTRAGKGRRKNLREESAGSLGVKENGTRVIGNEGRLGKLNELGRGVGEAFRDGRRIGQVGRARNIDRIKIVERHPIARLSIHGGFDASDAARSADGGAFAVHEVVGGIDEVVADAGAVELGEILQNGGGGAGLVLPIARGPIGIEARIDFDDRGLLREIVNFRGLGETAKKGLFERHLRSGGFVGLIGGEPEILAERVVIAIDADLAGGTEEALEAVLGNEIGTVEMIIADADVNAHIAIGGGGGRDESAEGGGDLADIEIEEAVFDEVGLVDAGKMEARDGAVQLVVHGVESLVFIAGGLLREGSRAMGAGPERRRERENGEQADAERFLHGCCPFASGSWAGGGRIGGLSVEVSFLANSISEMRMAGETAETGTEPDSAPQ